MIADLYHYVGSDLAVSPAGDVAPATGAMRGQQRILRRLLTNPGDYIWHPEYGAGLPQWIGKLLDIQKITALVRGQILLEDSVAKMPEPQITITPIQGGLSCTIKYTDAQTGAPQVLGFNVKA